MHYARWVRTGTAASPWPDGFVPGYAGAHARVYASRGKASEHVCSDCGEQAQDWAYDHTDPHELTGPKDGQVMAYSLDPAHYRPLCKGCHAAFDAPPALSCSVGGCEGEHAARGLCYKHYRRLGAAIRAAS